MSGIVDPNGNGTSYSYDQQGRAISRAIQGVGVHTYLYQPGAILIAVDPQGSAYHQLHGERFRALRPEQNALGAVTSYTQKCEPAGDEPPVAYAGVSGPRTKLRRRRIGFQRPEPSGMRTSYAYDSV